MREKTTKTTKPIHCAIYTRKSTSEGLDQEFTTLDAQREAAENYIKSQKAQGWIALKDKYNDGGYTGADTNRPALQKLIEDIKVGKINCVVVYKVDRLSRSLLDFTRLLEFFDEYNTTFVSVTQHFNTDSSMGRLTLNILLSFAQFEREMISERTRDKIGAARKKGKWTGGLPSLGYDINRETHKLVVNEQEARLVRKIYKLYLETNSILNTTIILNEQGYTCKRYVSKTGRQFGGSKFTKNTIHRLLMNPIYTGKIKYQGILYNGEHKAIVEPELFEKIQKQIKYNRINRKVRKNSRCFGVLTHILRCSACDCVMIHTYSIKNKVKKYRYYVCLKAQRLGYATCPTRSLNAKNIEDTVMAYLPRIEIKNNPLLLDKYKKITSKIVPIWKTLVPDERRRIMTHLFESIDYNAQTKSLGFNLNEKGIYELYTEIHKDENQCGQNSK
jgi:site-specific DNA recombinase